MPFINLSKSDSPTAYLLCKQLNGNGTEGSAGGVKIGFPNMPEMIEITRSNDFSYQKSPLFPDGVVAYYAGSDPISIPFSFTASMYDPNCKFGPIDLIRAAKFLHAMALPIATLDSNGVPVQLGANTAPSGTESGNTANAAGGTNSTGVSDTPGVGFDTAGVTNSINQNAANAYSMPPGVQLMIFENTGSGSGGASEANSMGINMNGFLKDVTASLRGPWVKAEGYNGWLPSSAEYRFTFVFFPSYTGDLRTSAADVSLATTTAQSVQQYFFGTQAVQTAKSVQSPS